jgi:WD40 repeat protein
MSPEQARGLKVDHRTDLFSLGTVLYRLCTGHNPFTGPTVMAVLMALGSDDPAPVRELNPNVPEPLAQFIHQLLSKKPEGRPQTAAEVAKRLRAILEEVLAPPASAATVPAPTATAADVSSSQPIVAQPVPMQPPIVVPMQISAPPESVFANLGAADTGAARAEPAPDEPKPERKKSGGKGPLVAAGVAVLLAVVATVVVIKTKNKDGTETEIKVPDGATVAIEKGGKEVAKVGPEPWKPGPVWKPVPAGQSPFDKLDPREIPQEERFDWQPKELVAVIGSHARRHWTEARSVAVSPDGKYAATAGSEVIVWDMATQTPKWTIPATGRGPEFRPSCTRLVFSPDGKRLVISRRAKGAHVQVWDLSGTAPVPGRFGTAEKPGEMIWGLGEYGDLLEDGRTLSIASAPTASGGKTVLLDITGEKVRETGAEITTRSWPLIAAQADRLFYATPEGKLRCATVKNAKFENDEELPIKLGENEVPRAVTPDGKRLVVWGGDHLQIWDVSRNPPKQVQKIASDGVVASNRTYVISPDGRWLIASHRATALFRIDGAEPKFAGWLDQTDQGGGGSVAFGKNGNRAVVGNTEGFVRFWDLSGAEPKEPSPFDPNTAFVASPYRLDQYLDSRGGRLMLERYDAPNRYQLWDLSGARPVPAPGPGTFLDGKPVIWTVAGGRWLAEGWDWSFQFFELADGKWRAAGEPFGKVRSAVTLSARPAVIAVVDQDGPARLESWDLAGEKPNRLWSAEARDFVNASGWWLFQCSADGRWIATPRRVKDGRVELVLWRNAGAKPEVYATLPIKNALGLYRNCFSPDGRYLAHTATPDEVGLVDLTGKEPRETSRFVTGDISSLAFHPDSKKLAWGSVLGAGVLDVTTGKPLWNWGAPGEVSRVEFAHDGRHLFLHNANKTVYVLRFADPDRASAEWVLSAGGKVMITDAAGEKEVATAKELPAGTFTVTRIDLSDCAKLTDADLDRLAGLTGLTHLHLDRTAVTDEGLARVKHMTGLMRLHLGVTKVTDAGLAHLKNMNELLSLSLHNTKVTDDGLIHLRDVPKLMILNLNDTAVTDVGLERIKARAAFRRLHLAGTKVTDAGLAHLTTLDKLTELDLSRTKVTAGGVAELQKALPKCKIEWTPPKK